MKNLEKSTDMGIALELATHIENPCTVEVNGREENLRNFYMGEAERIIPTFQNQSAKKFLESVMEEYK